MGRCRKTGQLRAVEYGYKIKIVKSFYDSFEWIPSDIKIAVKNSAERKAKKMKKAGNSRRRPSLRPFPAGRPFSSWLNS
jgi:hypothetical protein